MNYNNKVIFVSNRGIYALISIAKSIDDNWNIKRLDNDIKGIVNYELHKDAKAILHNDSYYLFLNSLSAGGSSTWLIYNESSNKGWSVSNGTTLDIKHAWSHNGILRYCRKNEPQVCQLGYRYYKLINLITDSGNKFVPAEHLSPGYRDGVTLAEDNTLSNLGVPVVSMFKTKSYAFGQPLHYKKYKKIQIETENFRGPTKFRYDAIVDGISRIPETIWELNRTDDSSLSWGVSVNEESIGTINGYTGLDTSLYYDNVVYRDDVTTNKMCSD